MRVSQIYNLGRNQPGLDFVDVDTRGDLPVFVDPRALRILQSEWGDECVSLAQNFFGHIISLMQNGQHALARQLLANLREPNETHLGFSVGLAQGRSLGRRSARAVWESLTRSEAAKSGLLEDLEDTILMVDGVSDDLVSDIVTNIIRRPLISYTQEMCALYGIPTVQDVASGPIWNPVRHRWEEGFVSLPMTEGRKLLLVPKVIVRKKMDYDLNEYYRHFLLEHLKEIELSANSELVVLLKDGTPRVTKKSLIEKYGAGKSVIVQETLNYPEILEKYRREKMGTFKIPLSHAEIAEASGSEPPNWDELLSNIVQIAPGRESADEYEDRVERLISPMFYPHLVHPMPQHRIHDGRKRIDITYTNASQFGFFNWLSLHYSAAHIFVECKNYGGEVGNPELDQLAGRFSPTRGQIGLLVCRHFDNKELFIQRCIDTAHDHRGYIIPLDDEDLRAIITTPPIQSDILNFDLLRERFTQLIF